MDATNELDFLRKLEQEMQQVHHLIRCGYSGAPEVVAIKHLINQRIIELLETRQQERAATTSKRL